MGMTLTQKILAAHAGLAEVKAGQLINAKLDIVLGNDITTPVAVNEFEKAGFHRVFDKEHIAIVLDHFVPNKDIKSAQLISGREPDGKTPDVTTEPQKPETLPGDVNADSKVNSADLVLLIQYLLGNKSLSKTGAANADLCADKTVNGLDAAVLRQNLTGN